MKKFYIPTSIVYTNRSPHIGFALELIQADALARYHRLLGEEVFFLTGTDEHGTKIAKAAVEAGKSPENFVSEIVKKVKELKKTLNLSNDDFIRTSDKKRHWPAVKKVWLKLKENGDIYKKKYKGLYCIGCEAFVREKDLINGRCPVHEKAPEIIEEENYFFRLSKYQNQLKKMIKAEEIRIIPETRRGELLSFINQGLEDVSCSRSRAKLEWGIPVPGDKTQTVYVWLEALVNYLSALDYATNGDKFKKFWPPDVHCIGKDIFIRFHGSLWPAMLLSLGLPLPKTIFVHGFITVEGEKMSKSLGNIIDPVELVEKYGRETIRYFFIREFSSFEDGDFSEQRLKERYNSDLAQGIGNLVSRVLALGEQYGKQIMVQCLDTNLVTKSWSDYKKQMEEFRFNDALATIWNLISYCDKYISDTKPWQKIDDEKEFQKILGALIYILGNISLMLSPIMPKTSTKIFEFFNLQGVLREDWLLRNILLKKQPPLFPRLDN